MVNKLNILQIGVGYWGPNILKNLIKNKLIDKIYIYEKSKKRVNQLSKIYKNLIFIKNFSDIYKINKLNTAIISTPANTHYYLAKKLLNKNFNLLVEKPLATTLKQVENLYEIANKKKLTLMSGHLYLFNPYIRYIKKSITSNKLGKLYYLFSQRLNFGIVRNDIDVKWNLGPHDVSIISFLVGKRKITNVDQISNSFLQKRKMISDICMMNINYDNGVNALIHLSWLDPIKTRKLVIVFSKGMIVFDEMNKIQPLIIYNKKVSILRAKNNKNLYDKNKLRELIKYTSSKPTIPKIKKKEPLFEEIDYFIKCIKSSKKPLTGYEHNINVIKILSYNEKKN